MNKFQKMRRFKQALSKEDCIDVLKTAPRGILALHGENDYPYAIPINQFYDEYDNSIYFHCAKEGLKLDLLEKNNKTCFTIIDKGFVREGEWALNIRSVICLGRIEILKDRDKIFEQCRKLARKFYPSEESIEREIEKFGSHVQMLVMSIDHISGKLVNES